MNINLDFSVIYCDLQHINPYTNKSCNVCGEDFSEIISDFDPMVELRKEALRPIYTMIESKKKERKHWFSKHREGLEKKEEVSDPFIRIQSMISHINNEISKGLFEDINLCSNNLTNPNVKNEINEFAEFMGAIHDILFDSEKLECKLLWKNINNRFASSVRLYKLACEDLINTAISLNYLDAKELQAEAQKKMDFANNEIIILNKILDNENVIFDYDLFKGGQLNQSPVLAMLFNEGEGTITETIDKTSELTSYYFNGLVKHDMEQSHLLSLSVYKYMGNSLFDDREYLIKIEAVLDLINKAYLKDPNRFRSFFKLYLNKFLYMQEKLNEFSVNFSYIVGNKPSNKLLMQNYIKWYKDLSEGVYREASRIVYFCMKLITNKEFEDDDILTWLGFGDIVSEFEQQKKLKLNKLTEGVEKIIRNSEAHVDYDIDDEAALIIVRNINVREKQKTKKEFTYEEFYDVTNKLAETIYSIICSIQMFMFNNASDFQNEIRSIEEKDEKLNKINTSLLLFAMSGIIIEDEQKTTTEYTQLSLKGKLVNEIKLSEFGQRIFNICAQIISYEADVDVIHFSLIDKNDVIVGKVKVPTKFLKLYQSDNSDFKDYYLLLAKLTSNIDGVFTDSLTNDNDLICIKSIFHLLLEVLEEVNHTFRDKDIKYNSRIKSENKKLIPKIELIEKVIFIYKDHTNDSRVTTHLTMVLNQLKIIIINFSNSGLMTLDVEFKLKRCNAVGDLVTEYIKVVYGEITLETYLRNYIKYHYSLFNKIGVNQPCPCNSGKKFKKCCRI